MEFPERLKHRLPTILLVLGLTLTALGAIVQYVPSFLSSKNGEEIKITDETKVKQNISKDIELKQTISDSSEATHSPEPEIKINIDVSGAVASPGVYQLPSDARLTQALESAGGLSKSADQTWVSRNLNLASKLKDGDKVYIPQKGESKATSNNLSQPVSPLAQVASQTTQPTQPMPEVAGVTTGALGLTPESTSQAVNTPAKQTTPDPNAKINVNTASSKELDVLPGVGPVTAQKIIDNRPYSKLEDLKEKKAVNKSTFEKIKDKITL